MGVREIIFIRKVKLYTLTGAEIIIYHYQCAGD